eukprot:698578-Hanusia_phi.AAC.1
MLVSSGVLRVDGRQEWGSSSRVQGSLLLGSTRAQAVTGMAARQRAGARGEVWLFGGAGGRSCCCNWRRREGSGAQGEGAPRRKESEGEIEETWRGG